MNLKKIAAFSGIAVALLLVTLVIILTFGFFTASSAQVGFYETYWPLIRVESQVVDGYGNDICGPDRIEDTKPRLQLTITQFSLQEADYRSNLVDGPKDFRFEYQVFFDNPNCKGYSQYQFKIGPWYIRTQ